MRAGSRFSAIASALALLIVGGLFASQIAAIGVARHAVASRLGSTAYDLRPANARAAALLAATQLGAGNLAAAERLARAAVDASPIDAVAVRTLAQVKNARSAGAGDDLMLAAASLTWRDQQTQAWVIERAIRAGDITTAFQRAEALTRTQRNFDLSFLLLRTIAQDRTGFDLLVKALAERPFWRVYFFYMGVQQAFEPQLGVMAKILRELRATPAPPTPTEARPTIDALAAAGRLSEAYRLHVDVVKAGKAATPNDGGFERTDADYGTAGSSSVFDWRIHPVQGTAAGVEAGADNAGNRVLFVTTDGNAAGAVASQTLVLAPGRYTLQYRVRSDERSATETLRLIVRCADSPLPLAPADAAPLASPGWSERGYQFQIPGSGCRSQALEIRAAPSQSEQGAEATFDDIRIARAG